MSVFWEVRLFAPGAGDRGWVSAFILGNVAHLGHLIAHKVTSTVCDEKG